MFISNPSTLPPTLEPNSSAHLLIQVQIVGAQTDEVRDLASIESLTMKVLHRLQIMELTDGIREFRIDMLTEKVRAFF